MRDHDFRFNRQILDDLHNRPSDPYDALRTRVRLIIGVSAPRHIVEQTMVSLIKQNRPDIYKSLCERRLTPRREPTRTCPLEQCKSKMAEPHWNGEQTGGNFRAA